MQAEEAALPEAPQLEAPQPVEVEDPQRLAFDQVEVRNRGVVNDGA